jgi:hypothetical protein
MVRLTGMDRDGCVGGYPIDSGHRDEGPVIATLPFPGLNRPAVGCATQRTGCSGHDNPRLPGQPPPEIKKVYQAYCSLAKIP